jgi:AraC family transcriptional regulator
LNGSAIVEGDIFHRSLSIDENARFEGSSRREETVIDAPPIPIIRPEAQADVDTVVAMEGSRKHNGPLENTWLLYRGGLAPWQQRRVVEFIEQHLAEDISLDALAELVRLSPYHFLRCFKRSLGEPPHRYWTARRIERAKTLPANPRASVTEVAFQVGFSGTSAFSAAFRRITGQTATDYRLSLE